MITTQLNVDNICQTCPCFSPTIDHCCTDDGSFQMVTISCDHHDFCMGIRSRIKKELYENLIKRKE